MAPPSWKRHAREFPGSTVFDERSPTGRTAVLCVVWLGVGPILVDPSIRARHPKGEVCAHACAEEGGGRDRVGASLSSGRRAATPTGGGGQVFATSRTPDPSARPARRHRSAVPGVASPPRLPTNASVQRHPSIAGRAPSPPKDASDSPFVFVRPLSLDSCIAAVTYFASFFSRYFPSRLSDPDLSSPFLHFIRFHPNYTRCPSISCTPPPS